jgi:SSS family transporter
MDVSLELGDYVSLIGYFCIVIGFGIWSSCKNRGSLSGYFLAGRSMHFIPVGASLFASNIGSGHFIGLAGAGASTGIGTAGFELSAGFILILLGWVFLPVYIRAGVYTMPEYIKKRFGGDRIRIYLSILSLVLYVFTKISADLFSGAIFIKESLDLNLYAAVIILLAIAALFTIGGGLSAVIWTDFIQTIIMILGAFYLMIVSFMEVGGFSSMKAKFSYAVANTTLFSNSTCGIPTDEYFNLIRNVNSDYPWVIFSHFTINLKGRFCFFIIIKQRLV